jgi:hypothetical protein
MSNNTFTTTHTETAAYLMACGHRLLDMTVKAGRVAFTFGDVEGRRVQETVAAYAANEAIPAKSFMESYRLVKTLAKDSMAFADSSKLEVQRVVSRKHNHS